MLVPCSFISVQQVYPRYLTYDCNRSHASVKPPQEYRNTGRKKDVLLGKKNKKSLNPFYIYYL